ncbi:MAG: hypothetical protein ACOC83_03495, partial [Gemmatimonadota bacterium]
MQAINDSALTIAATASEGPDGEPMLLLENTAQGVDGNDQPIVASNLEGEVETTRMVQDATRSV